MKISLIRNRIHMSLVPLVEYFSMMWESFQAWGEQLQFAGGDGTEENPFLIETAKQLNNVRNHLNAHFKLIADIDLNVAPFNQENGWEPIGSFFEPFNGTFDGNGYKIKNLFIDRPDQKFIGLFSMLDENSVIQNVGLENVNVTGGDFVCGIVGYNYGTIEKSYVTGTISGANYVGGIVGYNYGTIESTYVTGTISGNYYTGGLVGSTFLGVINNCYVTGTVSGVNYVGGLVGYISNGIITNTYAMGTVSGNEYVGSIVGDSFMCTVTHSYYDRDMCGQVDDASKGVPICNEDMKKLLTFEEWDFNNIWYIRENKNYPTLRWQGWKDYSRFGIVLDKLDSKIVGKTFNLSITDAKGIFDNILNGDKKVTVTSNHSGEVFNDIVTFNDGKASVPITLNVEGTHSLTIWVDGITNSKSISVEVI